MLALGQRHSAFIALLVLVVDKFNSLRRVPVGISVGEVAVERRANHEDAQRRFILAGELVVGS